MGCTLFWVKFGHAFTYLVVLVYKPDVGMCIKFATVCGVEWDVYAAAFTPQNGAIVRTDSVRTKAHLKNFETCMRNLNW